VIIGSLVDVTIELSEAPTADVTVTLTTTPILGSFDHLHKLSITFTTGDALLRTVQLSATAAGVGLITGAVSGSDQARYADTHCIHRPKRHLTIVGKGPYCRL